MASNIILVLVTAIITAALTIGVAWFLYDRYGKPRLMAWIDDKAQDLGELLKDRVREGASIGIKEGLADVGSDVVKKTREGAAMSGLGLIEESMNTWFGSGRKKKRKSDEDDG